ncbi:MAG TPA: hypothetical protein VGM73_06265 [Candidatus Didemnitutus sp.]|jgi:hypothetical protein
MPIDHSFECTPSFRDLTQTGLLLLGRPVVRSLRKLRELRNGAPAPIPVATRTSKRFRRSPLPGSLS